MAKNYVFLKLNLIVIIKYSYLYCSSSSQIICGNLESSMFKSLQPQMVGWPCFLDLGDNIVDFNLLKMIKESST